MSDQVNDGGPAFPHNPKKWDTNGWFVNDNEKNGHGMSLRDWFAGMALQSILKDLAFYEQKSCEEQVASGKATWNEIRNATDFLILADGAEECAWAAYSFADAMIEARRHKAEDLK